MKGKSLWVGSYMFAYAWLVPLGLEGQGLLPSGQGAQNSASAPIADSARLAFEREVFAYPEYSRRNPFRALVDSGDGGPRFERLVLLGILYSPFAGESLALFAEGTRTVQARGPGVPERVTVEVTGGTYRVREGESLGNMTVRRIDRHQVAILVEEFGLFESRIMLLARGTSGLGSPQ